jgi:DNA-binding MarR family transcriptional regulator
MLQHLFLATLPLSSQQQLFQQSVEEGSSMNLQDELMIKKQLDSGHEVALSLLLTREYLARLFDEAIFKRESLTDQQFNVLRILKGGPPEGYLIRDIRRRMIYRNADVPRLVDRLVKQGLVARNECEHDRRGCMVGLTAKGDQLQAKVRPLHEELCQRLDKVLSSQEQRTLIELLERLRDDYREQLAPSQRIKAGK